MAVLGDLNRSVSTSANPISFMQQQLKCLEERMKLVEMKVDTAVSAIGEVADAIDKNYTCLTEIRDAVSGRPSSNSQQNLGELSTQLKEIQALLKKESSNRIASKVDIEAEFDSELDIELNRFHKATAITEQDQSEDNYKERFERDFGYEIEQLSEIPYEDEEEEHQEVKEPKKKQNSSSSSCISFGKISMCKQKPSKSPVKSLVKNPLHLHHSSDESTISEGSINRINKIQDNNVEQISLTSSPIVQKPVKSIVQEPVKSIKGDLHISFKDISFCEWISESKEVKNVGRGQLDFQKHNLNILVNFKSIDKYLNYWMKADVNWQVVGDQKDSVVFRCYEDLEGNGSLKMMVASFDGPSNADKLCHFFEESFE